MPRVRRARAADGAGILAAHTAAIRVGCPSHYAADEVEAWIARLGVARYDDDLARREMLVAAEGDRVLGFGVLDVDDAEVRALYVHPEAGRAGVGRQLLDALEAIARLRGLREVGLDSSLNAVGFYATAGWRRVRDARRTFAGGPDIACVTMTRTLPPLRLDVDEETGADLVVIEAVERAAFERADEATLVARLRREHALALSLVARLDAAVVGHAALSPVTVDGAVGRTAGLGPIAVVPALQRCAIGARLVEETLARARARGVGAVVVLGHPEYYPRFGFVPARRFGLRYEDDAPEEAFMAAEIVPGALARAAGVVRYHAAFGALA